MLQRLLVLASAVPLAAGYVLARPAPLAVPASASLRAAGAAATPAAYRSTPATMNLGDRFVRLVKSNLNSALSSLEDPEKVLEQAVNDMQRDLTKVRQAYAEVSASSKRAEEQMKLAESEAAKWYSRAQLALEKGEEDLAREALARRQQQLELVDNLRNQVEGNSAAVTSLYDSMKELEVKMSEAKSKKDQIIARARTAKASTKVNDMLAGVGSGSSMAAFEKMSAKVDQLESEAEVSKQLSMTSSSGKGTDLDAAFKRLERGGVDDELAKMKRNALAPATEVDDELAKMKRLMAGEAEGDKSK